MTSDTGVASILGFEKKAEKNQPNGYAGLDANKAYIGNNSTYWHAVWDNHTSVVGNWISWNDTNQTDYDPLLNSIYNIGANINDVISFGNINLNAGKYKLSGSYYATTNSGIATYKIGTTTITTHDSYAGSDIHNVLIETDITFSSRVSGVFSLNVLSKNAASGKYAMRASRIELIRV